MFFSFSTSIDLPHPMLMISQTMMLIRDSNEISLGNLMCSKELKYLEKIFLKTFVIVFSLLDLEIYEPFTRHRAGNGIIMRLYTGTTLVAPIHMSSQPYKNITFYLFSYLGETSQASSKDTTTLPGMDASPDQDPLTNQQAGSQKEMSAQTPIADSTLGFSSDDRYTIADIYSSDDRFDIADSDSSNYG
ncbi:hypothetical protein RF11_09960 [Thelohanellus kitauei]|uniref:Uncharacterized protein n=1 Tax=Thelohanellus kitauei TaxID=669202 RepID=A0A0C2JI74_THEKT|nr:hypothetical protein RF11_09960 [Thelohanellus kitauei]